MSDKLTRVEFDPFGAGYEAGESGQPETPPESSGTANQRGEWLRGHRAGRRVEREKVVEYEKIERPPTKPPRSLGWRGTFAMVVIAVVLGPWMLLWTELLLCK